MGLDISKNPFLYSVGTELAYKIAKRYYNNIHYVWCTTEFNSLKQPPTSNPATICKRYLEQITTGDRHTKEIENKVFEVEINKEELKYFQDNYRVSNLYHNDEKIIVRLVTDNPPENHKLSSQSPTLEDLYLYIFEQGM